MSAHPVSSYGDFHALVESLRARGSGAEGGSFEGVRLRHHPGLGSPEADVVDVRRRADGSVDVTSSFLGLTGMAGPLPGHLLEEVLLEGGRPLGLLTDLFHERLLQLFHELVLCHRPGPHNAERWVGRLAALAGGDVEPRPPSEPPFAPPHLLPALVGAYRGASTVEDALRSVIARALGPGPTLRLHELAGGRCRHSSQATLGACRLGRDSALGDGVRDPASGVVIEIGPLEPDGLRRLREEGALCDQMRALLRAHCAVPLRFVVEAVVTTDGFPRLGADARLGLTTWLGSGRHLARWELMDSKGSATCP